MPRRIGNRQVSLRAVSGGNCGHHGPGPREESTATFLSGLKSEGRCRRTACGTPWDSWQCSSAVVRCPKRPGYRMRSNLVRGFFRCLRREEAVGMRVPCGALAWFLPGDGYGGHGEEAATVTPRASVLSRALEVYFNN